MDTGKRTPGPWKLGENGNRNVIYGSDNEAVASISIFPGWQANAAFIVRACNSHDRLVEALKEARNTACVLFEGLEHTSPKGFSKTARIALHQIIRDANAALELAESTPA